MQILSEKARAIATYLGSEKPRGNWPIQLDGRKQILPFYRFKTNLLRYNVKNGRLASEIREWEKDNGEELNSANHEHAKIIKKLLLEMDTAKTNELKIDILEFEQMEPGVITHDGVIINGNRRMAVIQDLNEEHPGGKWEYLEAIILPSNINQKDLWKIEAGLQLSKDKVAPYSPVNELLKIKEGIEAGLTPKQIAAVLYGRTEDEIKESIQRLKIIDDFLSFFSQQGNYPLINQYGLTEYFINIQKSVIKPAESSGVGKKEELNRLKIAFELIKAHIKSKSKGGDGVKSHTSIRKLRNVFDNSKAYLEVSPISQAKRDTPEEVVIEAFNNALDIVEFTEEKGKPTKLIKRAIRALESIDPESEHFATREVKQELEKLNKIIKNLTDHIVKK